MQTCHFILTWLLVEINDADNTDYIEYYYFRNVKGKVIVALNSNVSFIHIFHIRLTALLLEIFLLR